MIMRYHIKPSHNPKFDDFQATEPFASTEPFAPTDFAQFPEISWMQDLAPQPQKITDDLISDEKFVVTVPSPISAGFDPKEFYGMIEHHNGAGGKNVVQAYLTIKNNSQRIFNLIIVQWGTIELHDRLTSMLAFETESRKGFAFEMLGALLYIYDEHANEFGFNKPPETRNNSIRDSW